MNLFLNLARASRRDEILLPAEGETVPADDDNAVTLFGRSGESKPGEIVATRVTPESLKAYIDFSRLHKLKIDPNADFQAKCITLSNPKNPPPGEKLKGTLELQIRFNPDQADGGVLYPIQFSLSRFPDWQGIFAIDFGNTSTTCVVLPPDVYRLFADPTFRCLNWSQPDEEGEPQPTAIQFKTFDGELVTRWEVGGDVVNHFKELMATRSLEAISRYNAYRIGGIKRGLAGKEKTEPTVSSVDGQIGPVLTGNELNGYTLKRFIRRSEECQAPGQVTQVGRFQRVIATHPVNFNPIQLDAIREVYDDLLGIKDIDLRYDEATAAAIYYLAKQLHGADRIHEFWTRTENPADPPPIPGEPETHTFNMLVFDCGGGTTDIALMRVEIERRTKANPKGSVTQNWFEVRPTVFGLTGMKEFAGDNMTLEAMRLIRFQVAEKLAMLGQPLQVDVATWAEGDRENFSTALEKLQPMLMNRLEKMSPTQFVEFIAQADELCKRIVPTDFKSKDKNPSSKEYQLRLDLFHQLWQAAETLKQGFCKTDTRTGKVFNEYPALIPDQVRASYATQDGKSLAQDPNFQILQVRRCDLDALIAVRVHDAWELAADLCEDLAQGERVHQVVLAGNGCRYPLVKEMLRTVFADSPQSRFEYQEAHIKFDVKDAKLACAKGAAIAEWFRLYKPTDINTPDQTVVVFQPGAVNRLPYPILYQTLAGHETLFERGRPIPADKKLVEKRLHPQPQFAIKQGLKKQNKDVNVPYCLFNCERADVAPPVGMDGAKLVGVVFRVDELHELTAAAVWAKDEKETETPLRREELKPSANAKFNNPFEGWN